MEIGTLARKGSDTLALYDQATVPAVQRAAWRIPRLPGWALLECQTPAKLAESRSCGRDSFWQPQISPLAAASLAAHCRAQLRCQGQSIFLSVVVPSHGNKVAMPTVVPDISTAAVNTQHPLDFLAVEEVHCVVAIEGIGVTCRAPGQVGI